MADVLPFPVKKSKKRAGKCVCTHRENDHDTVFDIPAWFVGPRSRQAHRGCMRCECAHFTDIAEQSKYQAAMEHGS